MSFIETDLTTAYNMAVADIRRSVLITGYVYLLYRSMLTV